MINNNKILTVSYGTFSCTLEGFDDSFDTMKAIAEYFRDLAAEDRYFGAEPPQPDADMLARIAQHKMSRQVEAREHEGRIVLSATTADAATTQIDDATPSDTIAAAPDQDIETSAREAELSETTEPVAPVAHPDKDTVAEAPEQAIVPEIPVASQTLTNVPDEAEAFFANTPAATDSYDNDISEAADDTAPAPQAFVEQPAVAHADDDSIASKLERIRMVVAKRDTKLDEGEDETVDQPTEAVLTLDDMPSDLVVHIDETEDLAAESDELGAVAPQDEEAPETEALTDNDEDETLDVISQAAEEIEEALSIDDDAAAMQASNDSDSLAAILDGLDRDLVSDDDDDGDIADEDLFNGTDEGSGDHDDDDGPLILTHAQQRADAMPSDADTILAADDEAELENFDFNDAPPVAKDAAQTSLSDEDEDALQKELAALEANLTGDEVTDNDDLDELLDGALKATEEEETSVAPTRHTQPALNDTQAEDVLRLMEEAEHQMDEPESSDRRSAFAHLRAAVAAKIADRAMGNKDKEEESQNAYRTDLAEAVKPHRSEADNRAAPLKLVAEQRVDVNPLRDTVRLPRQALRTDDADAEVPGSFTEFATEMGATKLPDLLEAAAAYMSFVEGHSQFSRPQLMTKVRQVEQSDFSREDGLRSFGELLRSGKIEKIRGGRFTVSDQIGFKPDERAAG
ncbi:MAG: hypothetical protein WBC93_16925 [Sulfitobacter sp.]